MEDEMTSFVDPDRNHRARIGAQLLAMRDERELTQVDLAKMVGVTVAAVSQWECGDRTLPQERYPALAKALGMSKLELEKRLGSFSH
jgi:transcriptional regulator with XRE-family HTH domain